MYKRMIRSNWLAWTLFSCLFSISFSQGEIIYGMNREPDMLDLHVGSSRYDLVVAANIYDTYLYLTAEGEFLPWLAEEVTMSEDAKVYTMKLRPDVTFHDGTPLNAEAVKFNFDRIVNPDTASRAAIGDMGSYESTEIVDDLTVQINFSEPHPGFWYALSDWRAGGPHSPTAISADAEAYLRSPVGTGPFKFVEWVERDRIVLEPYEDYAWPYPRAEHEGRARPDRIIFRMIPEDQSRVIALTTGEINAAMRIPPQSVAELEANSDIYLLSETLPGTGVILVINGGKAPTNDIAVRQAILHATSAEQINQLSYFNTHVTHLGSVLSAPNPGFVELSDMYPFDLEKAAQLLDEAGWVLGSDGIREKDGVRAELVYIGFPSPETTRALELMQANLQTIGIGVVIQELDSGAIQKARQDGEHNIAHLTWIFKDPGFLRTLFHSENIGTGWNFTHMPDPELDTLLEQGEVIANAEERLAIYEDVQRRVLETAIVIPTVYQEQTNALRNEVQGVKLFEVYGEAPYFYDAYVESQ
jgi:peptide/nickel transport system substrate-binding protein